MEASAACMAKEMRDGRRRVVVREDMQVSGGNQSRGFVGKKTKSVDPAAQRTRRRGEVRITAGSQIYLSLSARQPFSVLRIATEPFIWISRASNQWPGSLL